VKDERDPRFAHEEEVRLPSAETWGPFASTITGEDDDDEPGLERRFVRPQLGFKDRYETLGVLSAGSHAEIRLVRDLPFAREVTMKVLLTRERGSSSRWRFFREARVQAQLSHPAVVPVYDLGVDPAGDPYFTMKWVRGLRFDQAMCELLDGGGKGGPTFTQRQLLERLAHLCLAIHYAHRRGVVHRDLKPTNVMVGEFGELYVLDWGLAKVLSEASPRFEPIDDVSGAMRTSDGSVLGTIGFMAPEQLQGEVDRIDARADVYSIGSMLFQLLALEPMHQGSAANQALSSLRLDGASPRERRPDLDIDPDLDRTCYAATRADLEDRLESSKEIADAIEAYLTG